MRTLWHVLVAAGVLIACGDETVATQDVDELAMQVTALEARITALEAENTAYADALKNKGVRCETLLFSRPYSAHHGFLFFRWLKPSKIAFAAVGEYLRDLGLASQQGPR